MTEFSPTPTSHSFISQRLRLNYLDWGNSGAPVLILQHGGRDHAHSWDWVARELCRDWHVIAPDLCGHGDSAWSPGGVYQMPYFIYDFMNLVDQLGVEQVSIVAHSLGGNIATRYTGLFPEKVRRLVNIEGLGIPQPVIDAYAAKGPVENWKEWLGQRRAAATRQPRRYKNMEDAFTRMREENKHLSWEQARHLTIHGIARNEDGTWSWKFDNYVHSFAPLDIPDADQIALWRRIACPVLLVRGRNSWAPDPEVDGKIGHFQNARAITFDDAGHWPHHDRFVDFVKEIKAFL